MINWKASPEDNALIEQIADRYLALLYVCDVVLAAKEPRTGVIMDLTCVHLNIQPLRLADLLAANDLGLLRDVRGIRNHLIREDAPRLNGGFLPRFSKHEDAETAKAS